MKFHHKPNHLQKHTDIYSMKIVYVNLYFPNKSLGVQESVHLVPRKNIKC